MGFMDKIKDAVGKNAGKAEGAVDKVAETVDEKTGKKHTDKIDKAAGAAKDALGKLEGK